MRARLVVVIAGVVGMVALAAGALAAADDTQAAIDRIAGEVAKLRGLHRKKPIAREVLDADALRAKLGARASSESTAAETLALERWGVLPAGADYGGLVTDVLTAQIAAYYDHDAHELYVPDQAGADDGGEMLLAHELDHALVDQSFELGRFEAGAPDGDARLARRAVVEGDGMALMIEYVLAQKGKAAPWSDPDLEPMLAHMLDAEGPAGGKLGAAPLWVREEMLFPYRAGLALVASIRRRHPWSSVDGLYRRPPRSTAQVLHPELYAADVKPVDVALAVPSLSEIRTVWSDVWGEERWATFLRAHGVDDRMAFAAAAGWAGDRVAVFARDGDDDPRHAIGVARTVWATDVDADEAAEALVRAMDGFAGTAAERSADAGRWTDDGRVAWVARRGREVVVVIGAPAPLAQALADEVWASAKSRPRRGR